MRKNVLRTKYKAATWLPTNNNINKKSGMKTLFCKFAYQRMDHLVWQQSTSDQVNITQLRREVVQCRWWRWQSVVQCEECGQNCGYVPIHRYKIGWWILKRIMWFYGNVRGWGNTLIFSIYYPFSSHFNSMLFLCV